MSATKKNLSIFFLESTVSMQRQKTNRDDLVMLVEAKSPYLSGIADSVQKIWNLNTVFPGKNISDKTVNRHNRKQMISTATSH